MIATSQAAAQALSLSECIDYAIAKRYDISAYSIEDKVRQDEIKARKYKFSPSISGSISNSLSHGYQQVFTESEAGTYQAVKSYSNSVGLTLSMPIWSADAQIALIRMGELNRSLNLSDKDAKKFDLAIEITGCYYSLLAADEQYNVALSNYASQDSIVANTEKLYHLGKSSKLNLLDAKTNLNQYKQDLLSAYYERDRARLALISAMQYESDSISLECSDNMPILPGFDELYEHVLSEHPSLKSSQIEKSMLSAENKTYRRQLYPSIYLNYDVGTSSQFVASRQNTPALDQWGGNFHQSAAISISVPIFSKMSIRTNIRKNELAAEAADNEELQIRRQLYDNLKVLYSELYHTQRIYEAASESEKISGEQVMLASDSYRLGLIPSYEYEIYRQKHKATSLQALQAKYEWLYKIALLNQYLNL